LNRFPQQKSIYPAVIRRKPLLRNGHIVAGTDFDIKSTLTPAERRQERQDCSPSQPSSVKGMTQ
jgi:hypothetical protein